MFHLIRGSAYLFAVLRASFNFLYTGLVTIFTYIVLIFDIYIYIYMMMMMMMYVFFTYLFMCCFFSLFTHMLLIYCMQSFIFLFHTKMPWWVLFKVFQKYMLSKSFLPWTLFLQSFSRVCVRIRFYCIQQVIICLVIYHFSHISFVCYGFVTDCQRGGGIFRTYVGHVMNICHLELAYHLTKRTLLVFW